MALNTAHCPKCGSDVLVPVEPLFNVEEVCMLVPVKQSTLQSWCSRNAARLNAPLYTGAKTRRRRLFTASDVRAIRAALVSTKR